MAGQLLAAQANVVAEVKAITPKLAERQMASPLIVSRGRITAVTLISPLLEPDRYLVARLPEKTVNDLSRYISGLPEGKKRDFIRDYITRSTIALMEQYAKAGSSNRFQFTPQPIPKYQDVQAEKPGQITPRRVEAVRFRPIGTDVSTPERIAPRPLPLRIRGTAPSEIETTLQYPPRIVKGDGRAKTPLIISIPVPSNSAPGTSLRQYPFSINISEPRFRFSYRLHFVSARAKGDATADGDELTRTIIKALQPMIEAEARRQAGGSGVTISHEMLRNAVRNRFIMMCDPRYPKSYKAKVAAYIRWSR